MSRLGIQLHTEWPLGDYARLAQRIEDDGFAELTVHDVIWKRPLWPVLTVIAEHTSRLLVGPDVTHPFARHPVTTASNIAAIDEMTGGRAILGIGQGSFFEDAGIAHDHPITAVREMIEVVNHLLSGERSAYQGQIFQIAAGAALRFPTRPVRIFVGSFGPRMIAMAAPLVGEIRPPGMWRTEYLEVVKQHMAGGHAELAVDVWPFAAQNRAAAEAMARQHVPQFLPYMKTLTDFYGTRDVDDAIRTFCAVGDEAELADGCARLFEAGAKRITFSGALGPDRDEALDILARVARRFD